MTFLGWLSDPFKGLSDLQPGDEKGTLNHLVVVATQRFFIFTLQTMNRQKETPYIFVKATLPKKIHALNDLDATIP